MGPFCGSLSTYPEDVQIRLGNRAETRGRSIRASTLVLIGDRDVVKPEHALELTHLIPGARLLIIPGGHGDYLGEIAAAEIGTNDVELTARLVEQFLAAPPEDGQR